MKTRNASALAFHAARLDPRWPRGVLRGRRDAFRDIDARIL